MLEDLDHVGAKITRIEEIIEQQMRPFQNAVNTWLTVASIAAAELFLSHLN